MRSRCGSYHRRARSNSAGQPARPARRVVTVSMKMRPGLTLGVASTGRSPYLWTAEKGDPILALLAAGLSGAARQGHLFGRGRHERDWGVIRASLFKQRRLYCRNLGMDL